MFGLTSAVLLLAFGVIVAVVLLAFPFVGLALIPVFLLGLLALVGFGYVFVRRGPEGLPEQTTSPHEPRGTGEPDRRPQ